LPVVLYNISMKHVHLILDETLLEEAIRVGGVKTYSGLVTKALEELVRRSRARRILELRGKGLWEGELSAMRGDPPALRPRVAASRRPR
jgi:Arc/MetJ family transcription regulator